MNSFPNQGFPGGPGQGIPGGYMPPQPQDQGKAGQKATKRSIMGQKTGILVFAAIVALLVLLAQFGSKPQQVFVVQARASIGILQHYDPASVQAVALPKAAVEPGTLSAPSAQGALDLAAAKLKGLVARQQIFQGEQLRVEFFQLNLQDVKPEERLVSIHAAIGASVAGTLRAGDHVDVIAVSNSIANVIGTDVTIVQATLSEDQLKTVADTPASPKPQGGGTGTTTDPASRVPTNTIPSTYVVKVSAAQAEQFALADAAAKLYLVLRVPGTPSALPLGPLSLRQLLCSPNNQGVLGTITATESNCK